MQTNSVLKSGPATASLWKNKKCLAVMASLIDVLEANGLA